MIRTIARSQPRFRVTHGRRLTAAEIVKKYGVTKRELRQMMRDHAEWREVIRPLLDAVDRSTRLTADDYGIIVRGA